MQFLLALFRKPMILVMFLFGLWLFATGLFMKLDVEPFTYQDFF